MNYFNLLMTQNEMYAHAFSFKVLSLLFIRICLGKVELVFIMLNYVWREIRSSETAEFLISSQNCGSWQSMVERWR